MARSSLIALLFIALAGTAEAQTPTERKTDDRAIIDHLAAIHDRGATLFNRGDRSGCYRLFQGSLLTVKLVLPREMQDIVDRGMAEADQIGDVGQRAMRLHELIEAVRVKLHPTAGPSPTKLAPPRPVKDDKPKSETDKKSDSPTFPPIAPMNSAGPSVSVPPALRNGVPTSGSPPPVITSPMDDAKPSPAGPSLFPDVTPKAPAGNPPAPPSFDIPKSPVPTTPPSNMPPTFEIPARPMPGSNPSPPSFEIEKPPMTPPPSFEIPKGPPSTPPTITVPMTPTNPMPSTPPITIPPPPPIIVPKSNPTPPPIVIPLPEKK